VIIGRLTLRLRVLVRRERLDRQLAERPDPQMSPELGLRAAQLSKTRTRRVIARRLRPKLRTAGQGTSSVPPGRPLARDQILAESDALMDLIRRLEAPGRTEPMGVALARLLLTDPVSPIYEQAEPATLYMAVRLATAAMGAPVQRSVTTQRS
jgi:hypothetical protein